MLTPEEFNDLFKDLQIATLTGDNIEVSKLIRTMKKEYEDLHDACTLLDQQVRLSKVKSTNPQKSNE